MLVGDGCSITIWQEVPCFFNHAADIVSVCKLSNTTPDVQKHLRMVPTSTFKTTLLDMSEGSRLSKIRLLLKQSLYSGSFQAGKNQRHEKKPKRIPSLNGGVGGRVCRVQLRNPPFGKTRGLQR